jgi:hypothetical protein
VQDIAKTIRQGWRPELTKAMKLPEQARRLDRTLKVAVNWMEVAREGAPETFHQAQYTRDKLEEGLSRVCFEMEVEERRQVYGEEHEDKAEASALSDALVEAFCILDRRRRTSSLTGVPGYATRSWVRSWSPRMASVRSPHQ